MKFLLRNYIARLSSYTEIYLSLIILAGVFFASVRLIKDLFGIYARSMNMDYFQEFLGYALVLIIAVEFIKMLSRHTPGSAIEVLLFALARKLIVSEEKTIGLLWGVIAIALLFLIRKYLFVSHFSMSEGVNISAATTVSEARKITGLNIPEVAHTIGGVVAHIAQEENKRLSEGEVYESGGIKMRISRLRDGIIEMVEVIKAKRDL